MSIFIGSGAAVCTPFKTALDFNYDAYEKLIRFQIENGTDAIVACGTTGEASTLDNEEHIEVVRGAVAAAKTISAEVGRKVPVVAGSGGNNTRNCLYLGKELIRAGADALMFVAPYYNKTSQKGLVEHYAALASSLDIPIIVYNIPVRTAFNILPSTFEVLSKIPNIVAVKEATGDMPHVAEITERCGDNLDIYSGNDDYTLPILALGGKGVISTVANIAPAQVHDLVMKFMEGDLEGSRKVQIGILSLVRAIFKDINPMPIKTALNLMGFDMGACRPPLTSVDDGLLETLKLEMKRYGLLP
jgi:4-hydroxy-tetrahydrodipicolinate synthase